MELHKEVQTADDYKNKEDWREEVKIQPEHEAHQGDIVDILFELENIWDGYLCITRT